MLQKVYLSWRKTNLPKIHLKRFINKMPGSPSAEICEDDLQRNFVRGWNVMYSIVGDSFGSRLLIESIHQERTFLSCLEYNFLTPLSKMNHKRKSRRIARCPISYYWDSIQQQNACYKTNVCMSLNKNSCSVCSPYRVQKPILANIGKSFYMMQNPKKFAIAIGCKCKFGFHCIDTKGNQFCQRFC